MRPVQVFLLSCIEPLPIQAPFPFEHGSEEDHQWKHGEIVENTSMKDLLSRLDVQGFVLDLDKPISEAPEIEGFSIRLDDPTTLVAAVPIAFHSRYQSKIESST